MPSLNGLACIFSLFYEIALDYDLIFNQVDFFKFWNVGWNCSVYVSKCYMLVVYVCVCVCPVYVDNDEVWL